MGGERELLLARVAEDLLTATDERVLLESAIALLGDSFGYDAFKRTCMSHTVLEVLASKWVYLVV